MFQRSVVRSSLIVALGTFAAALASAQSKVAVINMQKAVMDTAEIKKASAAIEAKFKPRQAEMEKIRKEVEEIQAKLQAGIGKLTPEAEADLNGQNQRKQRDLQRITEDVQADFEAERQDILGRSGKRMQEIVTKIANEKGLDLVVDVGNTIFFKPALEITTEATSAYDQAYPPK